MTRKGTEGGGRRRRSRLNWLILKTLACDVAVPMTAAVLADVLETSKSQFLNPVPRGSLRASLYRLAERGLVKLQELEDRRALTLTPRGRSELGALECYWKAKGIEWSPGDLRGLVPRKKGSAARHAKLQAALREAARRFPGRPRARGFVSYNIPRRSSARRREVLRILREAGYERMHGSFYVGSAASLKAVVEAIEDLGAVSFLRWGTLTVFSH